MLLLWRYTLIWVPWFISNTKCLFYGWHWSSWSISVYLLVLERGAVRNGMWLLLVRFQEDQNICWALLWPAGSRKMYSVGICTICMVEKRVLKVGIAGKHRAIIMRIDDNWYCSFLLILIIPFLVLACFIKWTAAKMSHTKPEMHSFLFCRNT